MYWSVSDTAEFGGYTRGPRLIDERTKEEMRRILGEIRTARSPGELVEEFDAGGRTSSSGARPCTPSRSSRSGRKLRPLMSWLASDDDQADA